MVAFTTWLHMQQRIYKFHIEARGFKKRIHTKLLHNLQQEENLSGHMKDC